MLIYKHNIELKQKYNLIYKFIYYSYNKNNYYS